MEHTKLQRDVVEAAKAKLKVAGIKVVCLDQLPKHDSEIERDGVEEWADALYFDTLLWEGEFP